MSVKLLTEYQLEYLAQMEAAQSRLSLHLSKCHIVEITCHGSDVNHQPNYSSAEARGVACLKSMLAIVRMYLMHLC